jgi:hypothetical protein
LGCGLLLPRGTALRLAGRILGTATLCRCSMGRTPLRRPPLLRWILASAVVPKYSLIKNNLRRQSCNVS